MRVRGFARLKIPEMAHAQMVVAQHQDHHNQFHTHPISLGVAAYAIAQPQPQTQTYGQPYMPTNAKGGSSVNMNYGPQQAPSSKGVGKGAPGYQGASTNSATSGQPQIGQPNPYSNTVGMRDNSMNTAGGGKGKGV